ncbi:MAG: UDP-N-acetylglucosamine 1-carboxyvinyltransferase [Holosporales bacterium]
MDKIRIVGGTPLHGEIQISGAKNAALPLLCATLLSESPLRLTNMPKLADIHTLTGLLQELGVSASWEDEHTLTLQTKTISSTCAPYDLVRKMRASILVLGPLLARSGHAEVSLPGGCAIGARPVDIHIKGLQALGAEITIEDGYIKAHAPNGLQGADITMPVVTVTGTENLLMAATLARGTTRLINAAQEPEVVDLAECLVSMGAKITGIGTNVLTIEGVERLNGAIHPVLPDRIETGTYAIAAVISGGDLELTNTKIELLPTFIQALQQTGATITPTPRGFRIQAPKDGIRPIDITTEPYPGYPTDLQAQMMALMTLAKGTSVIQETIFENRFMHVPELARMGADIKIKGNTAIISGVENLQGAQVMATDLRASVSLVLAGLAAEGETFVNRVYHLDRGYENIEVKLAQCGANITRLKETQETTTGEYHERENASAA